MMNKFLLIGILLTTSVWAQDTSEEALILNQELQFLEDSASDVTILSASEVPAQERAQPINTQSLEQKYFGNDNEDSIRTRTAAPKRRSY